MTNTHHWRHSSHTHTHTAPFAIQIDRCSAISVKKNSKTCHNQILTSTQRQIKKKENTDPKRFHMKRKKTKQSVIPFTFRQLRRRSSSRKGNWAKMSTQNVNEIWNSQRAFVLLFVALRSSRKWRQANLNKEFGDNFHSKQYTNQLISSFLFVFAWILWNHGNYRQVNAYSLQLCMISTRLFSNGSRTQSITPILRETRKRWSERHKKWLNRFRNECIEKSNKWYKRRRRRRRDWRGHCIGNPLPRKKMTQTF